MELERGFRLGDWEVHPLESRIVLQGSGEAKHVRRKAMDVLCVLAERAGQVVERDDLLRAVWGENAVTDEPLTSTIAELRRLLEDGSGQPFIKTIPKRGYQLIPAATMITEPTIDNADTGTVEEPALQKRQKPVVQMTLVNATALIVALVAIFAVTYFYLTRPEAIPQRSIAVLPFHALGDHDAKDFFAEGLAEELTSLLTQVKALHVAARSSAFALSEQQLDEVEIARRLRVAHLLSGTVQRIDDRIRVNVRLVDVNAGYERWSDTFDRQLDDIFAIQDEISLAVTKALELELVGAPPRARETTAEAYARYLQARHIGRQHTAEGLETALALYREVVAMDPQYLPAWNDIAGLYVNLVGFNLIERQEGYRRAREAAYRALALDPDYGPAYDRLGWLAMYADRDLAAAGRHYQRALALSPDSDSVQADAAVFALAIGQLYTGIALFERGVSVDPVSPVAHANLANAYFLAGRYREAEASLGQTLALSPRYTAGHYRLARALLAQDKVDAARQALDREPLEAGQWLGTAMVANATGDLAASEAALDKVRQTYGDAAAGNIAQVYAHRGDIDRAFEWLNLEYDANGLGGFAEFRWDPVFEPLRGDPRWPALLDRIGMGTADLEGIEFSVPDGIL